MNFFFGPGNNSLSHVMKCLSIMALLSSEEITDMMNYLYSDPDVRAKLIYTGRLLEHYSGAEQLVPILERV